MIDSSRIEFFKVHLITEYNNERANEVIKSKVDDFVYIWPSPTAISIGWWQILETITGWGLLLSRNIGCEKKCLMCLDPLFSRDGETRIEVLRLNYLIQWYDKSLTTHSILQKFCNIIAGYCDSYRHYSETLLFFWDFSI